ncbi:MAG TPA: polyphenol oxidase, partial [Brevundimonas sp.]|nr:polyphenol oxidase [Brevundimonas sp.]
EQAGVGEAAWTGDDTRADAARFYSNRRAYLAGEPDFGRLISAIALA